MRLCSCNTKNGNRLSLSKDKAYDKVCKFGQFSGLGLPCETMPEPKDFYYDLFKFGWSDEEGDKHWTNNKDENTAYMANTRFHDLPKASFVEQEGAKALLTDLSGGTFALFCFKF